MLAQNPNTAMKFDLDLARSQGDENPVFRIQSAHVRCAGIFRKAAEAGITDENANLTRLGPDELMLIRKLLEMEEVMLHAVEEMAPQGLASYALDLAGLFHPVYDKVRVLSEQDDIPLDVQKARLRFYRACKTVFARALRLMGMSAPEFMERREVAKPDAEEPTSGDADMDEAA
jgi:arginyl-tRNA synthetase